jgi:EmrB/QacA subfamily drug resistance transporter
VDATAPFHISTARRRWIVAACAAAMFMGAVEATIVATAMPTIVGELGGFHLFSWVFGIYVLTQAVTIPIYGRLADLYGRKRIFYASAALFLVGSTLAGFAANMGMLILFRAIQGIGAGGAVPVANTIIGDIYEAEDRARMQGYLGTVWGGAAVVGPVLGAFLIANLSWATVFWVNIPVGLFAIAVLAWALEERLAPRQHSIDYWGSLLLMAGTGAVMLAFIDWIRLGPFLVTGLGAAALLMLVLLLLHERRVAEPMLPLDLWRNRIVAASLTGAFTIGAVMMSVTAYVPTYVQGVMGRSPLVAGIALTSLSIGWTVSGALVGKLMLRSSYRWMAVWGGAMLLAGSLVLVWLDPTRGPVWAGTGSFLVGLGMGFSNTTFLVAAQSSVEWNRRGIATSLSIFMRQFGAALGAAVAGGLINGALGQSSGTNELVDRLMEPGLREGLPPAELARLVALVAGALHEVYLLAAAVGLVALLLAFALPAGLNPSRNSG